MTTEQVRSPEPEARSPLDDPRRVLASASSHLLPEAPMPDHVYKTIELVGSSSKGFDDAVHTAVDRAATTVRNLRWFEVTETRGHIQDGRIAYWQVTVKLGFTLED
jgi:flavin-binding protein dodecin